MTSAPLTFTWDGESMVPRHARLADKQFVVGQSYLLEEHQERSTRSHAHYFACIAEAHSNLPEDLAERFPTSEHLRKYVLIQCGYRDERSIVCLSKAEAQRVAGFMRPMDCYAVVTVSEAVVRVYTAQSQSVKAMGAKQFQESKTRVLDFLSDKIGVSTQSLEQNAGRAA